MILIRGSDVGIDIIVKLDSHTLTLHDLFITSSLTFYELQLIYYIFYSFLFLHSLDKSSEKQIDNSLDKSSEIQIDTEQLRQIIRDTD